MFLDIKLLKNDQIMLEEKHLPYDIENNIIHFKLENFDHYLNRTHKIFQRESDEFCFTIDLEKEKCTYQLKEISGDFDIIVDDSYWNDSENTIEIHYVIETEDEKSKIMINFNN
ncbi:MAG: hypothetical protein HFI08_03455 [Bacilli bacterium]|nr:hypothetical protein [Bacilli bacterium]